MLMMTREWVRKAEGDYDVVTLLLRSRKASRYDPICFHSQQCAEKYLKARLTEAGIAFKKTHDLSLLLQLALPIHPKWSRLDPKTKLLTPHAVLSRYPGRYPTAADTRLAVSACRSLRRNARLALGLKV
jgi:HEPN domain-containing protein